MRSHAVTKTSTDLSLAAVAAQLPLAMAVYAPRRASAPAAAQAAAAAVAGAAAPSPVAAGVLALVERLLASPPWRAALQVRRLYLTPAPNVVSTAAVDR